MNTKSGEPGIGFFIDSIVGYSPWKLSQCDGLGCGDTPVHVRAFLEAWVGRGYYSIFPYQIQWMYEAGATGVNEFSIV